MMFSPQRLMTMESLQDKIQSEIAKIKVGFKTNNDDLMRRLSEFILNSNEISKKQNRLIENYATNFASLGKVFLTPRIVFFIKTFHFNRRFATFKSSIFDFRFNFILLFFQSNVAPVSQVTWRGSRGRACWRGWTGGAWTGRTSPA